MRVKQNNKHANSKVNSTLTAQHIGKPNCKCTTNDDPYRAGEQSSKHTKPNARSAAANVRVHVAEEWAAPKAEPLPSLPASRALPLPMLLPLPSSYAPTLSMHVPGMYSYYPHPPMSQPIFSQSHVVPMAPPYFPPYAFSTYSYPPQM